MTQAETATTMGPPGARAATLIARLASFEGPPDQLLPLIAELQSDLAGARAAALLLAVSPETVDLLAAHPSLDADAPTPAWLRRASSLAAEARSAGAPRVAPAPDDASSCVAAMPLADLAEPAGVAAFLLPVPADDVSPERLDALRLATATLTIHQLHARLTRMGVGEDRLVRAVDLAAQAGAEARLVPAATTLVNRLAALMGAERVSLGLRPTRRAQAAHLVAVSGVDRIKRHMELVRDLESAMDESIDQDLETFVPASPSDTMIARQAERLATRHGPSAVAALPLRARGRAVGAVTVEREPSRPFDATDLACLRLVADLVAPRLVDLHARDQPPHVRAARGIRGAAASLVGPSHPIAKLASIAVVALLAGAAVTPGPHEAEAPFVAQTTARRAVAAPFDGYLASIGARVGDEVGTGDELGRLEEADLRLELAEQLARRAALARSADADRGRGQIAEAQITESRIDETDARVALLERRLERVTLRAPVGGVVLEAPEGFAAGSPVARGDTLFEVAPLETLRAEIALPESRLPHVQVGQAVVLLAAGAPDEPIRGVVSSIAPAATPPEPGAPAGPATFAVRVALEDAPAWLRPGMEGAASVALGRRPYLALWTEDLIDWVRLNLWL
jgi:multidrug resistance efflux pump